MVSSDTGTRNGRPSARLRLRRRLTPRRWLIVLAVGVLHLRFLRFHPRLLTRLEDGALRPLMRLTPDELRLAERWNGRIGRVLTGTRGPYARCMKQALVAALLLERRDGLFLVIGVLPDKPVEGHAWLELDGEIVSQRFDRRLTPYVVVRRLPVAPPATRRS